MSDVDEDSDSSVCVVFNTTYVCQHDDLCVAVSGSLDELGQWDVRRAAIAEETPEYSGNWSVSVELPIETSFEWKWVVIWRQNLTAFRWEERSNRVFNTGCADGHVIKANWNGQSECTSLPEDGGVNWGESDKKQLEQLSTELDSEHPEGGFFLFKALNWIVNKFWNMVSSVFFAFR